MSSPGRHPLLKKQERHPRNSVFRVIDQSLHKGIKTTKSNQMSCLLPIDLCIPQITQNKQNLEHIKRTKRFFRFAVFWTMLTIMASIKSIIEGQYIRIIVSPHLIGFSCLNAFMEGLVYMSCNTPDYVFIVDKVWFIYYK
jgi:hypothetical protein